MAGTTAAGGSPAKSKAAASQPSDNKAGSHSAAAPSAAASSAAAPTSDSKPAATKDSAKPSAAPTKDASPTTDDAQPTTQAAAAPTTKPANNSSAKDEPSPTSDEPSKTEAAKKPSSAKDKSPKTTKAPKAKEPGSTTVIITNSDGKAPKTSVVLVTSFRTDAGATQPSATASSTGQPQPIGSGHKSSGLSQSSKVAIGVVVPIAAIALLALAGLFFWKKHRARQNAAEERRKEVEDYTYNPNANPGMAAGDGSYEMQEDASSGYRGWGNTTLAGSTGRKASTTMSGGFGGVAASDGTAPTHNMSDTRSGEGLMEGSQPAEGEILGAMGPSATYNRANDVHRGDSNASSYSAAGMSEASEPAIVPYSGATYSDQYGAQHQYQDGSYGSQQGGLGAPVIRDNPARRNTRIENPAHYPGQSAGISQNF